MQLTPVLVNLAQASQAEKVVYIYFAYVGKTSMTSSEIPST